MEPAPPDAANPYATPESFWRSAWKAVKGEEADYTALPLKRAVLLLAVPMVLEMFMESIFAVSDVFWVAHLGKSAIAVVGLTEAVMTLVYAVAMGISIAATAIVARRIGEKEPEQAAHAAGQILILGVTVSAGIGVLLGFFAPQILSILSDNDQAVVSQGSDFARLMLGCNFTVFLIFLINAVFRGAGDATIAMRTLWLANALNIALGPCFVFGWGPFPEMGVTGAAVATNIGRGVGVLYQLWHLAGHHSRIKISLRHLKPDFALIRAILKTAGSGIVQLLISTTSWMGLFFILGKVGSAALAGYTIAIRIVMFALLPAWGLSNAGATLVGQNLGAKQPERAEAAVWIATKYNSLALGVVGLLFVVFSRPLIQLFTREPDVVENGVLALWIVGLALPMYAAGMCFESAFNGAGDTWTPARLNLFCLWLGQIPVAALLSMALGWGALGVYISVPLAFSALTIWSAVLFRRGRWKAKMV